MSVIKDLKEMPSNESKLKQWTLCALAVALGTAIAMIVWNYFRYTGSGANDADTSALWSLVHMGAYGALAVLAGIGLFGVFTHRSQFILWYLIACLAIMGAELVCLVWNNVLQSDKNKRYGLVVTILKVVALLLIVVSAGFAFLDRRFITKKGTEGQADKAQKPEEEKVEKAGTEAKKNGSKTDEKTDSKTGDKAGAKGEAKPKADKSKTKV